MFTAIEIVAIFMQQKRQTKKITMHRETKIGYFKGCPEMCFAYL